MIYKKQTAIGGKWAKASELTDVKRAKIVGETETQEGGKYGPRDVAKVRFEGLKEPLNTNINRASINALIDAYGEDSKNWMNKILSVETKEGIVSGRECTFLFLIPEGYERTKDKGGYVVIQKIGGKEKVEETDLDEANEEPEVDNFEDNPF